MILFQDRDNMVISQLSMVDLAGSERAARTGNQGDRIREAGWCCVNHSQICLIIA